MHQKQSRPKEEERKKSGLRKEHLLSVSDNKRLKKKSLYKVISKGRRQIEEKEEKPGLEREQSATPR